MAFPYTVTVTATENSAAFSVPLDITAGLDGDALDEYLPTLAEQVRQNNELGVPVGVEFSALDVG